MLKQNWPYRLWVWLSLLVPLYFGLVSLHFALSQAYVVQDDARLHIVWLQQWMDPDLFPQDAIAHYYQTIQAGGFKALYWSMAQLGIEPLLLAKLLPTLLALITTVYLFQFSLALLPVPAVAFLATLLLNQNIWFKDDLISATPRAFVYPLLAAFLYYLVRRRFACCLMLIGLTGWVYPQLVLVELGLVLLQRRIGWGLLAVGVAVLVILPYQQQVAQEFGALLSAAEMQQMPEFGPQGRREYFGVDPLSFALRGASGLRLPLFPPILWIGVALPFLRWRPEGDSPDVPKLRPLAELLLVSLTLFLLAHLLFPRLYLPSRYTFYSLRIVMAVAAGMVLFRMLEAGWCWWRRKMQFRVSDWVKLGLALLGIAVITVVPALPRLFLSGQGWISGEYPQLYRFLQQQPKASLIASLTPEADNLPAFTLRSVLVSRELALAYHPAFYQLMQQRIVDLVRAQYSPDLSATQAVLNRYGIDFLVIDHQFAQSDYLLQQDWLIHSSFQDQIHATIARLQQGETPALSRVQGYCTVLSEDNLSILDVGCLNRLQSENVRSTG
ncbi:hypothetical protein HJG54_07190 [Leptolyngbya sp. NK1-12]|uniref:Uncharacterized protein n=1 Tax=Leptolyngbya sp. NK1-12 TaxID=2547451 RepID=A0AA96WJT1_9CYAN|nr:hypothetical protein [Leptolyngbya sp. NK1-12]WNZ22661.1 hypothetical protein HJG54_07190 [Leptolyngbya sp. NK1-12]